MVQDRVTRKEGMSIFGISERTMTDWIAKGIIKSEKVNGKRFVYPDSVNGNGNGRDGNSNGNGKDGNSNGNGLFEIDRDIDNRRGQGCFPFILEDSQTILIEQLRSEFEQLRSEVVNLKSEVVYLKKQQDLVDKQFLEREKIISGIFMGSFI